MSLLTLCQWIETTALSIAIREGALYYPILGAFHLLGIAWFGGMLLMGDLSVLGVALRHEPVSEVWSQFRRWKWVGFAVILVSGTNGKSTTTAMLAAAMRSRHDVDSNVDGANTRAGLITTLAQGEADQVVLETDEGWLPWAVHQIRPKMVVLLNLSRDQLHRHPEVYGLAAAWRDAMDRARRSIVRDAESRRRRPGMRTAQVAPDRPNASAARCQRR